MDANLRKTEVFARFLKFCRGKTLVYFEKETLASLNFLQELSPETVQYFKVKLEN